MINPFFTKFETPFETPPFSKIKVEHYLPAFKEGIKESKARIEQIKNSEEEPTFENTIEELDYSDGILSRVSSVFYNLLSAETNDEMDNIANEVSPLMSEFTSDINLDEKLFARVKKIYDKKDSLNLSTEQITLLDKTYQGFVRNGANLSSNDKEKLRELDKRKSALSLEFSQNSLKATKAYELHLTNENDLEGIPDYLKEAAAETAKSKEKEGWIFTLDYPSFGPFLQYSKRRDLREKLVRASGERNYKDKFDNSEIIKEIANIRHQRANLLGYETHAHFVLDERMAKSPATVNSFLNDILKSAKKYAQKDVSDLSELMKKDTGDANLQSWDASFYMEKLKKERLDYDAQELKPYFKLENVINGAFQIANKLYGLTFTEINNIEKYHEDVLTYEVKDQNENHVAIFYGDYFPRDGKRGGAWMTEFREQFKRNGNDTRPLVCNVCNFTKPTANSPSLLTFEEVTTLFHEFGHGLHGILSKVNYPSLSGPSVYWDFVELPSQIMENWCYEKEALDLFAVHYETGEKIPQDLVDKIKKSLQFLEGYHTLRQLSFGLLDMAWHGKDPSSIGDVYIFEEEAMKETRLMPKVEGTNMSVSFGHIFAGGYSAGYYSYKWAEVLDADAFSYFQEKGLFNKEVADLFRENILEKGGSEHPADLYRKFRGRDPKQDALLNRAGFN